MTDTEAPGPYHPEIIGPFVPEHHVTIAGYHVPYVTVQPLADGRIELTVDGRFCLDGPVPREEFDRWIHILAHAMAVAAGYSSHGENCTPTNPHQHRISYLGSVAPVLNVIDGGKPE